MLPILGLPRIVQLEMAIKKSVLTNRPLHDGVTRGNCNTCCIFEFQFDWNSVQKEARKKRGVLFEKNAGVDAAKIYSKI